MTTYNHTPIATGAAANAATFNSPFGEIDATIGDFSAITVSGTPADLVEAIDTAYTELGDITTLTVSGSPASVVAAVNTMQAAVSVASFSETLKGWATAGAYEMTAITYNATYVGVIASATVKWPDGSAGTLTATTTNSTYQSIDAYTITHTDGGVTVTQTAVTRNAWGYPTVKPALTVA